MSPTHTALAPMTRTQRLALLTGLYTAQGLPYGFFSLALPVLLREAHWSLTALGFLQFLAAPWAMKFLWAPFLDRHGSRRAWLLGFQGLACTLALVLSFMNLGATSYLLLAVVFIFNLIAASQDVVTDGLAVRLLDVDERGLANAVQVGAFRFGMILGGGLLLWLFARTGWQVMFWAMAGLLLLCSVPVLLFLREQPAAEATEAASEQRRQTPGGAQASASSDAAHAAESSKPPLAGLALGWLHRLRAPGMLAFAGLLLCYRLGDQMLNSLLPPFLLDHGVSKEDIAYMKGVVGSVTSLLGASMGGWLTFRMGRRRALLTAGLAQAAGFLFYVAVAFGLGGIELLWAATVVEGIVGAMATVALFTLMMDASDPDHAGTDYTLFASVIVLVGGVANISAGMLGDAIGYGPTFLIATVLAALGCVFTVAWLDRHPTHPRVAEAWQFKRRAP
jgi:MFS transporter, PAT family, beta-lactamase induction signal transducer AmpG